MCKYRNVIKNITAQHLMAQAIQSKQIGMEKIEISTSLEMCVMCAPAACLTLLMFIHSCEMRMHERVSLPWKQKQQMKWQIEQQVNALKANTEINRVQMGNRL